MEGAVAVDPAIAAAGLVAAFLAAFLLGFAFFRAAFLLAAFFAGFFNDLRLAFFFAALLFFFFFAAFLPFLFFAMTASIKSYETTNPPVGGAGYSTAGATYPGELNSFPALLDSRS